MDEMDFTLHAENEITSINRHVRCVTAKFGRRHAYDKLILATGSRADVPNDAPEDVGGVFTMRTRTDADALKQYVRPGSHILIIGGGLLGLELAVALREVNVVVSILQL